MNFLYNNLVLPPVFKHVVLDLCLSHLRIPLLKLLELTQHRHIENPRHIFCSPPIFGALLFENTTSDARDHCANERTFLSWLRLSMYLAVVSVAIIISFHFREKPSGLEQRMSLPLGIVFWILSITCLLNGFANYTRTVRKYSRKAALVQSGWKTQMVFTVVGTAILGSCILFLSTSRRA